jgi:hypothetical protein
MRRKAPSLYKLNAAMSRARVNYWRPQFRSFRSEPRQTPPESAKMSKRPITLHPVNLPTDDEQ